MVEHNALQKLFNGISCPLLLHCIVGSRFAVITDYEVLEWLLRGKERVGKMARCLHCLVKDKYNFMNQVKAVYQAADALSSLFKSKTFQKFIDDDKQLISLSWQQWAAFLPPRHKSLFWSRRERTIRSTTYETRESKATFHRLSHQMKKNVVFRCTSRRCREPVM